MGAFFFDGKQMILATQVTQMWPSSVAGWAALALSVVAFLSTVATLFLMIRRGGQTKGQLVEQINGLGSRVGKVEKTVERHDERIDAHTVAIEKALFKYEQFVKQLLEAREHSDRREARFTESVRSVELQMGVLRKDVHDDLAAFAERLTRVEEKLEYLKGSGS